MNILKKRDKILFRISYVLLAIIILLSLSALPLSAKEKKDAIITAYDSYIVYDEAAKSIKLRAKIEKKGLLKINPDLEKEMLSF
ncbi:hypothetical protein ACFL2A_00340 [Thermodesulfobacteriota bacterium]